MRHQHSFHIPVMGIGFTLDTPLKVSPYGIDSVISLVDDILIEKLRKVYCLKNHLPYEEISNTIEDFRAKRITSYLNLMHELANKKFEALKTSALDASKEFSNYLNMLPSGSQLQQSFQKLMKEAPTTAAIQQWMQQYLHLGSIDVNIMTKIDKTNTFNKKTLSVEYNDAHAALRGFANSELSSTLVLSAGMNPRLYSYIESFSDFYPDNRGYIKKKIALKVSDFRSALIQGKFLAKKGIWVSEFRIESGLNCGGHAFATDGYLMGPILAQFRDQRETLTQDLFDILKKALATKEKTIPTTAPPLKISAQGGVGTAEEHEFLMAHYKVDSVGWGSPFLLVPETTTVDKNTLEQLTNAKEEDIYLSNISPLGVPFNNLKNNSKDLEKQQNIDKNRPGSSCPKKYVALNNEFADKVLCTASRQYQHLKIKALDAANLSKEAYQKAYNKIVEKSCICVGLGTATLLEHDLDTKKEGTGVSVCPGPNLAYFSKTMSLKEITDHIYGRDNMIGTTERPHMFLKELQIYLDYLSNTFKERKHDWSKKQEKYFRRFITNLDSGIGYYQQVFAETKNNSGKTLNTYKKKLNSIQTAITDFCNSKS
ncbi:MAG: hypothetical protein OIF50_06520 [Flavobacteriaceae bacterium]|nr:hypothetical protein [Flavobacteriaceae bacterium]